tara:strand:+ start:624 stop:932 length:309 start_codon:yes stop_codon:yes gene_type:complete
MNNVKKLLEKKIPFAVIQYFEYIKINKSETHKKYELMYIEDVVIKKDVTFKILKGVELDYFKNNLKHMEIVVADETGIVWEYGFFKNYLELTQKNKKYEKKF